MNSAFSRRIFLISVLATIIAGTAAAPASTDDFTQSTHKLKSAIEKHRQRYNIPGVAVVVVRNDQVVFLEGFGWRDVEKQLPVTPDSLFGIGSCTKAFTGMAAVISADDGKLSLDDSPKKYLPWFQLSDPKADAQATLFDLLTHRTGLKALDDEVWHKNDKLSREEVIKAVMTNPPAAKFRTQFQYNNVMYSVVGECIGRANGSSWEKVVSSRIFRPLGMQKSNCSLPEIKADSNAAIGYHLPTVPPKREKEHDLNNVAASGGINSSARDMAQWIRLMLGKGVFEGNRLLSEAGWEKLLMPGIGNYALGWTVLDEDGGKALLSEGGAVGHAARVTIEPDRNVGWAILANVNNVREFREFADAVEKDLTKPKAAVQWKLVAEIGIVVAAVAVLIRFRSSQKRTSSP